MKKGAANIITLAVVVIYLMTPVDVIGTVKFLAHFLTGGRPAVRYGYSCSSDSSR